MFDASGQIWDNQRPNTTISKDQDWLWKSFSKENGYAFMYGEEESGTQRTGSTFGSVRNGAIIM